MLNGWVLLIKGPYMSLHKRQVYAGLLEILKDSKYYYDSRIGSDYNHLTEEGKLAVVEYIESIGSHVLKKEKELLDAHAKQLVLQELKR